jgi:uncharacterized protein (DUF362 family)/NAD-dependent dihydropyrimidine dehydrogenase PreA subunit
LREAVEARGWNSREKGPPRPRMGEDMSLVAVAGCESYEMAAVRRAVAAALAPLGGIGRYVRPGMRVLLKPNLLSATELERAVTTHFAVVEAVAELVREAGATVLVGDSPAGPIESNPRVWRVSGMVDAAERAGARLVPFDDVVWKRSNGADYFIARPVFEADLVINLPKLKTHVLTLYTGAVKNLFGTIPGTRKREAHVRAPDVRNFGQLLVDVLELVRPGLTVLDGVWGQEGNGPGAGGTPRPYGCVAASTDAVALDEVVTEAMGYRAGEVLHLLQAQQRGLGGSAPGAVRVEGDLRVLEFGRVRLPRAPWRSFIPGWVGGPLRRAVRLRPRLEPAACVGCGRCSEVCPRETITPGRPPRFDLDECIGCMCCAEVCPEGAIEPRRNLLARLAGIGQ